MGSPVNIFWFRRDLRLHDNTGLNAALTHSHPVLPIFIFDTNILEELDDRADARVNFIHQQIILINESLKKQGSGIDVFFGNPTDVFNSIIKKYKIQFVFTNEDYEPYARKRDDEIAQMLSANGIVFNTYKDHVVLSPAEVLKSNKEPYTVFTPYMRAWKNIFLQSPFANYKSIEKRGNFLQFTPDPVPTLEVMNFSSVKLNNIKPRVDNDLIKAYHQTRDYPGINGTSKLGVHLRFGTISIRETASLALQNSETFLNELIWREFYQMIIYHFPHVVSECFKPAYEKIKWRNNESEFQRWCRGETGYPLVDAGMRELNASGFMHNRVRMVVASFLTKHLLIDWRWGEAYFAKKLLDYELASNNGGWQWAAGCGCDAAPYFRIFNPSIQAKKFDPELKYIRKWIPELDSLSYPTPIVEHQFARERCLQVYKQALFQS